MKKYYYSGVLLFIICLVCILFNHAQTSKKSDDHDQRSNNSKDGTENTSNQSPKESVSNRLDKNIQNSKKVEDLKRLLKTLMSDNVINDSEKRIAAGDIVQRLSSMMEVEDCIKFVDSLVGKGSFRGGLYVSIFSHSKSNTTKLLDVVGSFDDHALVEQSLGGLLIRLEEKKLPEDEVISVLNAALKKNSPNTVLAYCNMQISLYKDTEDPSQLISRINHVTQSLGEDISKDMSATIVREMMQDYPFDVWQLAGTDNNLKNQVFSNMLSKNMSRALGMVSLTNSDTERLQQGIVRFLNSNETEASKWIEENFGHLPDKNKDAVRAAQISYAIENLKDGNPDAVKKMWTKLESITDPAIKKQAEGQVWAKERDMVRNAVNKDPQQAITELVSGKSQHDSYWIEEAMDVWMAKDFDNAEKWYGDNWKSLPADKAQYAAASFAKQAIKTGDLDVAEQWLPYIQDPKTKERIQAEFSKAAGE